ncbi:MAG: hypothetical protein JW864_13525 [Spirochaetes bacterium]|nr:hypothetical protein [Spirochaetota bacterium]
MTHKFKALSIILCAFVFLFTVSVLPASSETDTLDIGVSGNLWLSGTIDVEGYDLDKDAGFLFKGYIDTIIVDKICIGGFLHFAPSVEIEDDSGKMYELGGAFKYRAMLGKMPLKIGIGVGYRKLTTDDLDDDIEGLGINASAELQFDINQKFKPFVELGFLSQPAGGNDDVDVTWSPIFYLGGGVAF